MTLISLSVERVMALVLYMICAVIYLVWMVLLSALLR